MSKSAIYTANTNAVSVLANGVIPVGNIVRRFGQNLDATSNGITTKGCGYYEVNASVTFEGTAAGTVTIQLYKDGVAVPGALATVTTADATTYNTSISAITRNYGCEPSVLTLVALDLAIDVTNVAVTVDKE